jgi:hypothetical protein
VIPGGNFLDGSLDLGDFNADGLSDIIVMGRTAGCGGTAATLLFENMGFMNFQAVSTLIPGFKQGRVTWGDYNNDGFSDLLFSGLDGFDIPQTSLFLNNLGDTTFTVNTAPTAPGNPGSAVINGNNVLYWSRSFDSKTPSEALTYNVMIGSQCNLSDILSPLANPLTGRRMVAANGNATSDTSFIIRDLVPGDYCFSVQAIDNGYLSGSFSTPEIFQYQPVGINHPQSVPFQLSPNPCSGILHISYNNSELLPASLSIMDMTGQILMEAKVPATMDLSALPAGIYLARFMYDQQPFFQKIIKR